ncbi:ABC transporter substrate-binding protein [Amycolatopsis sp. NPDC023774]|uniref:ABC transporter substrate-binding protein n=1 Tax=Amycolatopsis sp. NPDC023774 TaxID=3155015 RepID=UPI0033D3D6EA
MRTFRWPALLCAAALTLTACAAQETSSSSDSGELKIGASLELSGATASIGTAYRNALQLKVKQLNDANALGGRKISLVIRDNQTKPDEAIQVVNGLINNDKVNALIEGGCSACAVAAAKTVESKKMPTIALASASAITTPASAHPYTFKISPNPGEDAVVLMNELKSKSISRIGLLNVNNVYGQEGRAAVTAEAAKQGITVVQAEQFGETDKDMTVQLRNIVAKKPQAVVVWAVSPAAGIIATNAKDIGYTGGLYQDAGAGAELYVQGAKAAAEGTHMVFVRTLAAPDLPGTDPVSAAEKKWYSDYTKAYGPYSGFTSFASDALQMIVNAVKSVGTEPVALRDALEKMGIDGDSGRIQNSAENHSGLQPSALAVLEVRGGQWHLAK